MAKALVTGGGGFIGRALALRMLERGDEVRSFGRSPQPELSARGIDHVQGDLANSEHVRAAAEGCAVVFHVAGKVGISGRRAEFEATNITGTDNVISACRALGIRKLVFTSSPSVVIGHGDIEGADESAPYLDRYAALYPETKAEAERRVMAANDAELRTVSLRPHIVYGPGDNSLFPRIVARGSRLRRIGPPGKKTDVSYIDDVVDAHLLAAAALDERPEVVGGRTYFISSGEPQEIWPFIDRLLAAAGRPPVKGHISKGLALGAARVIDFVHRMRGAKGEPMLNPWLVEELCTSHWFDISAARRDLGYAPKVDVDEGMRRLEAWASEQA